MMSLARKLLAEGLGTTLLLAIVIGSGMMGERLAGGNVAVALLGNTLATGAGLIRSRRDGRAILYSADYDGMRALLGFLMDDCCAGRPEICGPLAELAAEAKCCP